MVCKINVLHLISSLEAGGAEKLLVELMKSATPEEDICYTVVVMNRSVDITLRAELENTPWRIYFLDRPEGHKHPGYLFKLLDIISNQRIHVIHAHTLGSKAWAAACKLFKPHVKLVMSVHSTWNILHWNAGLVWIHRHISDMNIAISKTVEDLMTARGIKGIRQIYNGIPLQNFAAPPRPRKPEEKLEIISVGRLDYRVKGQDVLLKALKLCCDAGLPFHCTLVGGVYSYNASSFEHLQNLVTSLGLEERVSFVVNQSNVASLLAKSSLFVLPSRHEGLGLAILEAMASRVPVIASNLEGPRELVTQNLTGYLFEQGSEQDLYEAIIRVYEHPDEAAQITENAFQFVQRFDITAMKTQYTQLYQQLVPKTVEKAAVPMMLTEASV